MPCLAGKSISCKNGVSHRSSLQGHFARRESKIMKSVSEEAANVNLFKFMFLLVDFGKNLCSLADKLQQNSNASVKEE